MSTDLARERIAGRLRANRGIIEEAIFREIRASAPDAVGDEPEYEAGLYAAVSGTFDCCIGAIETGGEGTAPWPAASIEQARRAARHDVGMETVVHRVALGERMVRAFATREAGDLSGRELNRILAPLGPVVDRLIHKLTAVHGRERERLDHSPERHRAELIKRLLAGERPGSTDEAVLRYPLRGWHLGVIGTGGPGVEDALRDLAEVLGCRLLLVYSDADAASGWLGGGQRRVDFDLIRRQPAIERGDGLVFACGEPGEGLDGWRLTHEQAQLGMLPGRPRSKPLTRAADVLSEVMLARERAAARLLVVTYLSAFESLRRNGEPARETLRAHFAHGRNVSATAAALGIARGTVENRLRQVERVIGRPLSHEHMTRLELALKVEAELTGAAGGVPDSY